MGERPHGERLDFMGQFKCNQMNWASIQSAPGRREGRGRTHAERISAWPHRHGRADIPKNQFDR